MILNPDEYLHGHLRITNVIGNHCSFPENFKDAPNYGVPIYTALKNW